MNTGLPLAVLFSIGWVPVFLFRTETLRDAYPAYGKAERFWVVVAPVVVATHIGMSCLLVSMATTMPWWRAMASLLLFSGGIGFWLWTRRTIAPLSVRRLPDEPPAEFRRDGPFGLVRNPLYLGSLLAAAAPALAAARLPLALSFSCCVVVLWVRAVQEERRLHEQLGAVYGEYCREVKRLVPFIL